MRLTETANVIVTRARVPPTGRNGAHDKSCCSCLACAVLALALVPVLTSVLVLVPHRKSLFSRGCSYVILLSQQH